MGEKHGRWILPTKHLFHARKVLLHAANLRQGTDGFTFAPLRRIFITLKNPSSSAGFELANLGSIGKHATTKDDPIGMNGVLLGVYWKQHILH
jgi:hypothetical protein